MNLRDQILKCAKPYLAPNKQTLSTISLKERDAIATSCGLPKREVEIAALDLEVWPQRYLRNAGSLGLAGQKKLLQSRALLIGVGGLGGTIAQLLARMGLGTLILADGDFFSEDNLNRQAFSLEQNIGQGKVQVACSEILKINAATEVEIFAGFVKENELASLIRGVNVAMDALDNMPTRFLLEKVCKEGKVPLVHGAVAGFSGQVTTIYPEDVGFKAFYGESQTIPEKGIEVELGNLAGIVSTVASLQVQEVIKIITGLGRPLRNRLLFLDSLNGSAEIISLK
ncbi:MAG: HesA/MoeB/ThiF family protein [Deltaproteobacteria bacterium]|jgi:molybdopterin/thiamine biosynthesis adenylyltransferase|nr:HesA/MoeB/ThiF family protein [Deltaproteobacteria bacterium]